MAYIQTLSHLYELHLSLGQERFQSKLLTDTGDIEVCSVGSKPLSFKDTG